MRVAHTAAEAAVYMTYLYTAYAPQLIKAGADWRRELSGHKEGTPTTALEFAMQKQGHDGALAEPEPEPEPSAEPEPKPEAMFNPGRDSYPTLTSTSSYPHSSPPPLPLSRRALHRAPPANLTVGARLPAPRGARPARQGGEEREAGELFQAVV